MQAVQERADSINQLLESLPWHWQSVFAYPPPPLPYVLRFSQRDLGHHLNQTILHPINGSLPESDGSQFHIQGVLKLGILAKVF